MDSMTEIEQSKSRELPPKGIDLVEVVEPNKLIRRQRIRLFRFLLTFALLDDVQITCFGRKQL